MIFALAGRRIDAPGASPERFPLRCVDAVRERIHALFSDGAASVLVCSAACGSDLIALGVAAELKMRRRIVLPESSAEFRERSVADRPGDWGPAFDQRIVEARASGDLEILLPAIPNDHRYQDANAAILERALTLSRATGEAVSAVAVWDGPLAGRTDYTQDFVETAERRGIFVRAIGIA